MTHSANPERFQGEGNSWEKIDETKKTLELLDVRRRWAVLNGGDVPGERGDTRLIHHMTQKLERRNSEHTLSRIDGQTILLQDLKKLLEMQQVFFQGAAGNEVVVQVCENEWQVSKQLIHEALERLSNIC